MVMDTHACRDSRTVHLAAYHERHCRPVGEDGPGDVGEAALRTPPRGPVVDAALRPAVLSGALPLMGNWEGVWHAALELSSWYRKGPQVTVSGGHDYLDSARVRIRAQAWRWAVQLPWHLLYFLPLPQGHFSFRPIFRPSVRSIVRFSSQYVQVHAGGCSAYQLGLAIPHLYRSLLVNSCPGQPAKSNSLRCWFSVPKESAPEMGLSSPRR